MSCISSVNISVRKHESESISKFDENTKKVNDEVSNNNSNVNEVNHFQKYIN